MKKTVSLVGLDKASVLAALYNASKPQGMGFLHYTPEPMTREEAVALLEETEYFDYLKGRVMKVDLDGDELDTWGYDRDNGEGAAEHAIAALGSTGETNPESIQRTHENGTRESAMDTTCVLRQESRFENETGIPTLHLGLSDMADELRPRLKKVIEK